MRQFVLDLIATGQTPQVFVDARRRDVHVPDVFRQYGGSLILDLDPSYPLKMIQFDDAFSVELACNGAVERCYIPWDAVWSVLKKGSGGLSIGEEPAPPSPEDAWTQAVKVPMPRVRSHLTLVKGGKA